MKDTSKALGRLYLDRCDIYEYERIFDEDSKALNQELVLKYESIKCKMSNYMCSSNLVYYKEDEFKNFIQKKIKLFLDKDIDIRAGSVVDVYRDGKKTRYKNCSSPSIYTNHQEIMLEVFDDVG